MIPPGKGFKEMQLGELERDNVSRLKIFISRPSEHYTFYIDHLRLEQKIQAGYLENRRFGYQSCYL